MNSHKLFLVIDFKSHHSSIHLRNVTHHTHTVTKSNHVIDLFKPVMFSLKSKCVCILDAFLPYDMNILHVWLCVGSTLIFHSLMFSSFCTQKQQQQQLVLINWEITILTPAGCSKLMFQILLQGGLMLSRTSAPKRTGAQRKSTVKKTKPPFFHQAWCCII